MYNKKEEKEGIKWNKVKLYIHWEKKITSMEMDF